MKLNLNQSRLQQEIRVLNLELGLSASQCMLRHPNWSQSVSEDRPLIPGTLRGYREWYCTSGRLAPLSFNNGGPWDPGWNQAHCERSSSYHPEIKALNHSDEEVPVRTCGCGFWGTYRYQTQFSGHLFMPQMAGGVVGGVIEAAGRVTLHRTGFRAERAQVKALFPLSHSTFKEMLPQVADLYQVPLLQGQKEAEEQFPPVNPVTLGIPPLKPLLDREQHKWHAYTTIYIKNDEGTVIWSGAGWPPAWGTDITTGDKNG